MSISKTFKLGSIIDKLLIMYDLIRFLSKSYPKILFFFIWNITAPLDLII